eukprot:705274-Pleurochrysis_carterae.AAC.1
MQPDAAAPIFTPRSHARIMKIVRVLRRLAHIKAFLLKSIHVERYHYMCAPPPSVTARLGT